MAKKLIYLELNDKFLLLSQLKKKGNKFLLTTSQIINLSNLELEKGILYNISKIFLYIHKFLKTKKLKNPKTIACIPALNTKKETEQKLNILQTALCMTKAGLKIEKIIGQNILKKDEKMGSKNFFYKKDLDKQLDFFKQFSNPENKRPLRWLLFLGLALIALFTTLYLIQTNKKIKLNQLQKINTILISENKILEEQVKTLHSLKEENEKTKKNINKIKRLKNHLNNPLSILLTISKNIPENSWLENLSIDKGQKTESYGHKKASKRPTKLTLNGMTYNEEEISIFIDNLSKSPYLKDIQLTKIQKVKKTTVNKNLNQYNFIISGQIKK